MTAGSEFDCRLLLKTKLRRQLELGDVHVWTVDVAAGLGGTYDFHRILSFDEMQRAGRFRFDRDRYRFVVSRAFVRVVLSFYIPVAPKQIIFEYDFFGKPTLTNHPNVMFSLSRSNDVALLVVACARQVGVDVESLKVQRLEDLEDIAREFFSGREYLMLRDIKPAFKLNAFFTLWTCKEAFSKALGLGLSLPLDFLEVLLDHAGGARFIGRGSLADHNWYFATFCRTRNYIYTLVSSTKPVKLRQFSWSSREGVIIGQLDSRPDTQFA